METENTPENALRGSATLSIIAVMSLIGCASPKAPAADRMSFFVTSMGSGNGGDLGGLAGADAHCQRLAESAGSHNRTWRAYLSTTDGLQPGVNARDRIGRGPWVNAKGVAIAASLDELHGPNNRLGEETSLDEHGETVGYWHDMLTGSNADGTVARGDATCRSWTGTQGHAMLGHSNKNGRDGGDRSTSWNSAHESTGCTLAALQTTGGNGRFYCFAVN